MKIDARSDEYRPKMSINNNNSWGWCVMCTIWHPANTHGACFTYHNWLSYHTIDVKRATRSAAVAMARSNTKKICVKQNILKLMKQYDKLSPGTCEPAICLAFVIYWNMNSMSRNRWLEKNVRTFYISIVITNILDKFMPTMICLQSIYINFVFFFVFLL